MSLKTLLIYNSPILFEILNEIKKNFNLNLININEDSHDITNTNSYENSVMVSQFDNSKDCLIIKNLPKNINKIMEEINIEFISRNFNSQSSILINDYKLDINSKKISRGKQILNLTEKEVKLIVFIRKNNYANLKDLQKNVWGHSSDLETHTVETHIYRLRKKFQEIFKVNDFIKYDKKGYFIN